MRKVTQLSIVIMCLVFSTVAWGKDITIQTFINFYDQGTLSEKVKIHKNFGLVVNGMGWANSALYLQKRKPIYCEPGGLVITGEQAFSIFRQAVESRGEKAQNLPGNNMFLILQYGLIETFPCK